MKQHRTWLEINSADFHWNINQIKTLIGCTKIGLVIKANAYGHGIQQIGQLAQNNALVDWFCVATLAEAFMLTKSGIEKPILILTPNSPEIIIEKSFHYAVYSLEQLKYFAAQAGTQRQKIYIHLKIDTGMSRLGFTLDELSQALPQFNQFKNIVFYGIFSHLCDTNNPDQEFTQQQILLFKQAIELCRKFNIQFSAHHLFASGMLYQNNLFDLVRVGTAAYGFWKSAFQQKNTQEKADILLKPILTSKTRLLHVSGNYGYLPVGFVDGLPPALANKGFVYLHDQRIKIIEVYSNVTIIDISNTYCSPGDEVILLGNKPGITATDIANFTGTINNEITTRICPTIERIII